MSEISTRELDLIIKELERLNDCYTKLNDAVGSQVEQMREDNKKYDERLERARKDCEDRAATKVDKTTEKWKYMLIFGSYGFTMFLLGWFLKMHALNP